VADDSIYRYASRGLAGYFGVGRNLLYQYLRTIKILEGYGENTVVNSQFWGKGLFKMCKGKMGHYALRISDRGMEYLKPLVEEAIAKGELKRKKEGTYRGKPLSQDLIDLLNNE
jgi:hypothetical protein